MSAPQPHPTPVVYIVDDDLGVRDSLQILLRLHGYAATSFSTGEALLASLDESRARAGGVVLLDLRLPGMSGAQVQAELAARKVQWPIVILTAHGDVASARNALKAGAIDFIEKPIQEPVLLAALEHGISQQRAIESDAARKADFERRLARLTPREREVLAMIVEGRHNREVAQVLGISPRTVEVYKARVMDKLDVERLPDLIRLTLK
jgi:two-component system response regulator FixJ